MTQQSLDDFGAESDDDPGLRINRPDPETLSDDATLDDTSCPWCLAPASHFRHLGDGRVGCGNCHAVIPTDADWYNEGEKIVV